MNTSYFFSKKLRDIENPNIVSISMKYPETIFSKDDIRIYKQLCPGWTLIMEYKKHIINEQQYTNLYYENILNKLNPKIVYNELGENAILLCWEKPGIFCHRRIVADWFKRNLNVDVLEL